MRQQVEEQLDAMRKQETYLQQELVRVQEQLVMTRGAVQVLERLLEQAAPPSDTEEADDERS